MEGVKSCVNWSRGGMYTTVFVAMEGSIVIMILIEDTIREDATAFLKGKEKC